MKRPILFVGLFAFAITTMAQTDYQQWEVMNITPKADKLELFKKGLAAHNKKYHSGGPYKVSVLSVQSGPSTGQYTWIMGPTTWTQMDSRPGKGEHEADWEKNVTPYVESSGEVSYWRIDKELNYQHANAATFTKGRLRFFTLMPGEGDRFTEVFKKVVEVYKKKEYKAAYSIYWRFGASQGPNVAVSLDFEKWAYFDSGTNFQKDFEEVHGANSWQRYQDDFALCVDRSKTFDELTEYLPELSGN